MTYSRQLGSYRFIAGCLLVFLGPLGCGGGSGSSQPPPPAWMQPVQNVPGIGIGSAAYSDTLFPVFRSGVGGYQIASWRENSIVGNQSLYRVMVAVGNQGSWSSPVPVSSTSLGYDLAVGPSGDAVVGTYEADPAGGVGHAFTLRRRVAGAWEPAGVAMELPKSGEFFSPDPVPKVAIDAGGNAVAVWRSWSNPSQVLATRWVAGTWSPVEVLAEEIPSVSRIQDIGLSVSPAGDAIVWWMETRIGEAAIRTSRWLKGLQLEIPVTVGVPGLNTPGTVRYPNPGMKVLWLKDGSPMIGRYGPAGTFDVSSWVGGGWSTPVSLPALSGQGVDNAFQFVIHHLALDPSGNPQGVWVDHAADGSVKVMAAGYTTGGWLTPKVLGTSNIQFGSNSGGALLMDAHTDGSLAMAWLCGVPDSLLEPATPFRIGEMVWGAQGLGPVKTPIGQRQVIHPLGILNLGGGKAQLAWCVLGSGGMTWSITISSID